MASSTKVKFTLLASEWGSKRGGLSTFNRVLAIELAKHSKVHVSVLVPRCDQEEIDDAKEKGVVLVRAEERPGYDEKDWLSFPPDDLQIDIVIGHGVVLGRQAQIIRRNLRCKWVQFVHTDPEELGMFKDYLNPITKSEQKHKNEVALCAMADFVVAVGPKLAEAYRSYLRSYDKDQRVFDLTPGIFDGFSGVVQAIQDRAMCRVLVFGRGDAEDFSLKGFDTAAEAVGQLPKTILYVVGAPNGKQDEVADKLKQHIPRERLRVRRFIESREELRNLFQEVDVAIMPSRTEGFGLAALEALSAGLPILVGGNSGFAEVLAKVPNGSYCVIQSEKPMVWSEEIKKVLAKQRETRLEEANLLRTYYAKKYSWEKQCNDLVEHVVGIAADEEAPSSKRKAPDTSSPEPEAGPSTSKSRRLSGKSSNQTPEPTRLDVVDSEGEPAIKQRSIKGEAERPEAPKTRGAKAVKKGCPSDDELEELSLSIGNSWESLARRLGFSQGDITGFHKNNEEYQKKPLKMLFGWKQQCGSKATYKVLHSALCHRFVKRKDLAEKFCCC